MLLGKVFVSLLHSAHVRYHNVLPHDVGRLHQTCPRLTSFKSILSTSLEDLAIKKALGDHAYKISLNSTKSMIGHPLGAAGGIEAVVTIKTMQEGLVHPTRNLEKPDLRIPLTNPHFKGIAENFELRHYLENPGLICDLDYTPKEARERNVDFALSNSFGFFGHNVVLAFGKYKG